MPNRARKWLALSGVAISLLLATWLGGGQAPLPLAAPAGSNPLAQGGQAKAVANNNESLDPRGAPYYAKGDGRADDSAALQAWLDDGGTNLTNGIFRITKGLVISGSNRSLRTLNAKILADGTDITALNVSGDKASLSVHVDGNNKAAYGLVVTGAQSLIENGTYENFRSRTQSARGIDAATGKGVTIRGNVVRNVLSVGDGVLGNANGSARGIAVHSNASATAPSSVTDNHIENVLGEEGDGIQVLFTDGKSNPYDSANLTISGNEIRNVSRRFIKIQASHVSVENNTLDFDVKTRPANPAAAINVIQAEYVTISGNRINPNLLAAPISVSGSPQAPLRGIEIRDNDIRQAVGRDAPSIYLLWTMAPSVVDNSIYGGGTPVAVGSSSSPIINRNLLHPTVQ